MLRPRVPPSHWQHLFHEFLTSLLRVVGDAGRSFEGGTFVIELKDSRLSSFIHAVLKQSTPRLIARTHRSFADAPYSSPKTAQMEFMLQPPLQVGNSTKKVALMYIFDVHLPREDSLMLFLKLEGANAISVEHAIRAAEYYGQRARSRGRKTAAAKNKKNTSRRENGNIHAGRLLAKGDQKGFGWSDANVGWYEKQVRQGRELFIPDRVARGLTPTSWQPQGFMAFWKGLFGSST